MVIRTSGEMDRRIDEEFAAVKAIYTNPKDGKLRTRWTKEPVAVRAKQLHLKDSIYDLMFKFGSGTSHSSMETIVFTIDEGASTPQPSIGPVSPNQPTVLAGAHSAHALLTGEVAGQLGSSHFDEARVRLRDLRVRMEQESQPNKETPEGS